VSKCKVREVSGWKTFPFSHAEEGASRPELVLDKSREKNKCERMTRDGTNAANSVPVSLTDMSKMPNTFFLRLLPSSFYLSILQYFAV
jgi:hypothetical protein